MSRNFYMRTRVGKTEAVLRVDLKVKRGSRFLRLRAALYTLQLFYLRQRKSTLKVVVHGDLTSYRLFFFERITILIRNSVKAGVIRTSEAHSCSVPTTGISIASLLDLSSLANRGIPSAFLMACLFFVLLLQLHKASAPQRATSACMADALARDPQSRRAT